MKRLLIIMSLVLSLNLVAVAQEKTQEEAAANKPKLSDRHRIPDGSKIYIAPMEGRLEGFIAAELMKKKLPIVVVLDEKDADYIIAGASLKGEDKWFHSMFGTGRDRTEANIQVISVKDRAVVWAGEAGDRSLWWGNLKRGGQRRVADRLIDKFKSDLFRR